MLRSEVYYLLVRTGDVGPLLRERFVLLKLVISCVCGLSLAAGCHFIVAHVVWLLLALMSRILSLV